MPLFGKKKQNTENIPEESEHTSSGHFSEDGTEKVGSITVRICSRETGMEEYKEVEFVRVISKRYNLLIMKDYMPMIGEIEGSIFFRDGRQEYKKDHIIGYFMHKQNVFSLMIKEEGQAAGE